MLHSHTFYVGHVLNLRAYVCIIFSFILGEQMTGGNITPMGCKGFVGRRWRSDVNESERRPQ